MRDVIIKVYKFSELSEKAKERAKQDYEIDCGYNWGDEAMDSIKALVKHFDGSITDWQVYWDRSSHSYMRFDMPEMTKTEIRRRLKELGSYNKRTGRGNGDCKLTGFCMDEACIDGFRLAFRKGETDLEELMEAAFDTWLKECQDDYESQFSDEVFGDACDANGWEFYENGSMVR